MDAVLRELNVLYLLLIKQQRTDLTHNSSASKAMLLFLSVKFSAQTGTAAAIAVKKKDISGRARKHIALDHSAPPKRLQGRTSLHLDAFGYGALGAKSACISLTPSLL